MSSTFLFSFNDTCIYDVDVASMRPGSWLTDNCLSLFVEWIRQHEGQDRMVIIDPAGSFMLLFVAGEELIRGGGGDPARNVFCLARTSQCQLVVEFVNNNANPELSGGGTHWSLLVIDKALNTMTHYDSCPGMNSDVARKFGDAMFQLLNWNMAGATTTQYNTFKFVEGVGMGKQNDGCDCGCYAISNLHRCINPQEYCKPSDVRRLLLDIVKERMGKASHG